MQGTRRPAQREGHARRTMRRVTSHPVRDAVIVATVGALMSVAGSEAWKAFTRDRPSLRATGQYAWAPEDAILFAFAKPLDAAQQARVLALHPEDAATELEETGGVQFGQPTWRGPKNVTSTRVEVVVERHGSSAATIIGMHAVITKRGPRLSGAQVLVTPQGDGKVSKVAIDLDSPAAVAREEGPHETLGRSYFLDRRVTVSEGDPATFVIQAYTHQRYYEWKLAIDMVVDGQSKTLYATNRGHPFRSTASANTYSATYRFNPTLQRFEKARA